jgi:hypothetical protein
MMKSMPWVEVRLPLPMTRMSSACHDHVTAFYGGGGIRMLLRKGVDRIDGKSGTVVEDGLHDDRIRGTSLPWPSGR